MSPPKRILIVGASIAGPAFASFLLLSCLPVHITTLERAPCVRPEGQNVDLRSVGIECIERLGLEKVIRANLTGEEGVHWVDGKDRAIASVPASKAGERQGPTADIEILRGTLARLVVRRCEEIGGESAVEKRGSRVEFIYDDYIETLDQQGDSVLVTLAKSKTRHTFDLVVGADGLQSRTRRQAFGVEGETKRVHRLGIYGFFFSMPRTSNDSDWRKWFHAPGRRGVMIRPSDRPDRVTVFMHKKVANAEEEKPFLDAAMRGLEGKAAQKALARETSKDMEWTQTERVLRELEDSEDFYYDMIAQVKMERWSQGRVVLIGDAAHSPSPLTGMGTSLALSGAYNLAGALASHPDDISAALDQYEKVQRPLVEAGQKLSPAVGLLYGSDTELRVWLVNWFVACVAFFGPVLKLFFLLAGGQGNAKGEGLREYGFKR